MSALRHRCPFSDACPFRTDRAVEIRPSASGMVMTASGSYRAITLACPLRDSCPLRLNAEDGLVRFHPNAVEILRPRPANLHPVGA